VPGMRSLISELRRRRVFRTAGLYLIGAWFIVQVAATTFEPLGLPPWTVPYLLWAVIVGFPFALLLGWRYEIGPTGISRTRSESASPGDISLRSADYVILLLVVVIAAVAALGVVSDELSDTETRRADGEQRSDDVMDMVAVLPFEIEGADTSNDYLIQGLSDELRNRLSDLPGLSVAGRNSSERFRDSTENPVAIANSLGVGTVIEGRVASIDDILSVRLEITDARTGRHVWGGRFDRPAGDFLLLQREVVTAVVAEIAPGAQALAAETRAATASAEANDHFLLGRFYDQQVRNSQLIDLDTMILAIEQYEMAIEADPYMADAHARLANAYLFMGQYDAATRPILAAESLDEYSSEVQYTLASYRMAQRLPRIEEAYQRAISLNPNNADALEDYAVYRWHQGDNFAPEDLLLRAIELDPLVLFRYDRLGGLYAWNGRAEDTLEVAGTVARLFPNDEGYMLVARLHELVGQLDQAIVWALKARQVNPNRPDIAWQLAELYARIGDFEMADHFEPEPSLMKDYWRRNYAGLIELGEEQIIDESLIELTTFYLVAFSLSVTGKDEQAIYIYEDALARFSGIGMPDIATHDSRVAISTEYIPHYAAALKAVGREDDAREAAQWTVALMDRHFETGNTVDWWATTYQACALVVLGEYERALELLPRIRSSPGLPWYPLLMDAPCFRPISKDQRFISVLSSVENRMATLRAQLPETLTAAGFSPAAVAP